MTDELLAAGRAVLAAQPFGVHLGAVLDRLTEGEAVIRVPIRPESRQHCGYVHGGLIAFAADTAVAFAAGSVFGSSVVTESLKIRFMAPAVGECLIARALLISRGDRDAECRCAVAVSRDGIESPCAAAEARVVRTRS